MEMKFPSIIKDLPFSEYLAIPATSSSMIKCVLQKSPLHAKYTMEPTPATQQQQLGTLFHELIERPESSRFIVLLHESDRASLAHRENYIQSLEVGLGVIRDDVDLKPESKKLDYQLDLLIAEAEARGKYLVTQEQYQITEQMALSVQKKRWIWSMIESAMYREATFLDLHDSGCRIRTRPDIVTETGAYILDLKTTDSADDHSYARTCERFMYDIQAALYEHVAKSNGLESFFMHLVVESKYPFDCRVMEFPDDVIVAAWTSCDDALYQLAGCYERNEWPGYPDEVSTINMRIRK